MPASPSPPIASASSGAIPLPDGGPKLLFDEHLPPQLVRQLGTLFPGSAHVYDLALGGATDTVVWEAARRDDFVLVTKDEDFQAVSVFRGHPPKIVWVRLGNASVAATVGFFRLKGDRAGQHAIAVNEQWRSCFRFTDGDAYDVEFCDYHWLAPAP